MTNISNLKLNKHGILRFWYEICDILPWKAAAARPKSTLFTWSESAWLGLSWATLLKFTTSNSHIQLVHSVCFYINCKLYTVLVKSLFNREVSAWKEIRYFCEKIYSRSYLDLQSRFLILANGELKPSLTASYSGCHPSNNWVPNN